MFSFNLNFLYLTMDFLDFHHHKQIKQGIYNLNHLEAIPDTMFSAGIHPKDITQNWKSDFEEIKKKTLDKNCIAVGECGLDGLITVDEKLQNEVFQAQLSWAEEIKKPVIIHCVRRFSQILHFKKAKIPLIIHGFNKKETIAEELLNVGFYLSFGRAAMESLSLQKIIRNIPIDRLFLETDNSDFSIQDLYEKVAEVKSVSFENLKNQMWENLGNIRHNG